MTSTLLQLLAREWRIVLGLIGGMLALHGLAIVLDCQRLTRHLNRLRSDERGPREDY